MRVAIASFGRKDVIKKALKSILKKRANEVFVTTPSDFSDFGYKDGSNIGNKNLQLRYISEHFNVSLDKFLFFDDSDNNVRSARQINIEAIKAAPFNEEYEGYFIS